MKNITAINLLGIAWKRLWALLLAAAVFAGCAYAYCTFISVPRYSATASVMVTNGGLLSGELNTNTTSSSVKSSDFSASLSITDTVIDILKTPELYKRLSKETGGRFSHGALMSMSYISRRSERSLFVDVTFTSDNREDAIKLVNMFVNLASVYIGEYIPYSYAKSTENAGIASQIAPQTTTKTVAFGLLGAGIVYALFLLIELFNRTIDSTEDFSEKFGIPLLGVVPDFGEITSNTNYEKAGDYGGY